MVTHPSSNWAHCRLTSLIEANVLTITLHRLPISEHLTNSIACHTCWH